MVCLLVVLASVVNAVAVVVFAIDILPDVLARLVERTIGDSPAQAGLELFSQQ